MQEGNFEKSIVQIQLWVDMHQARALHATTPDDKCRILSRNMKVIKGISGSKTALSPTQQLSVQAMESSTAQVSASFTLAHYL